MDNALNANIFHHTNDTQINWLEMARFAAEGEGHADLGKGVRRLATLAAAVHRDVVARGLTGLQGLEKETQWVHGRTPQDRSPSATADASPVTEDSR